MKATVDRIIKADVTGMLAHQRRVYEVVDRSKEWRVSGCAANVVVSSSQLLDPSDSKSSIKQGD